VRRQSNGQYMEYVEHLPAEQDDGNEHNEDGQHLAEVESTFLLEPAGAEAEDVEGGESEDERPEDVVNLLARRNDKGERRQEADRELMENPRAVGSPFGRLPHAEKQRGTSGGRGSD
jgi:hypothetical protein